jgi:hypothetical protein
MHEFTKLVFNWKKVITIIFAKYLVNLSSELLNADEFNGVLVVSILYWQSGEHQFDSQPEWLDRRDLTVLENITSESFLKILANSSFN